MIANAGAELANLGGAAGGFSRSGRSPAWRRAASTH